MLWLDTPTMASSVSRQLAGQLAVVILLLTLAGELGLSGSGALGSAIAGNNYASLEQNCILSFVVPRDKIKSSCDVNAKIQRRINAMETRADVYRQQVSSLRAQLDKQTANSAERLAKVEADLKARSQVNKNEMQLAKRMSLMEKSLAELQERLAAAESGSPGGRGSSSRSRSWAGDYENINIILKRFSSAAGGKEDAAAPEGGEERPQQEQAAVESLLRSMVRDEVNQLAEGLKDYVQEQVLVNNQVYSLLLPPPDCEQHGCRGGGRMGKSAGLHTPPAAGGSGAAAGGGHSAWNKIVRDEVYNREKKDVGADGNVVGDSGEETETGKLSAELKDIQSKLDEATGKIDQHVEKLIQNLTQPQGRAAEVDADAGEASAVNARPGETERSGSDSVPKANASTFSEDVLETNDTFSGEFPDQNATGSPGTGGEDPAEAETMVGEDDVLIRSSRLGSGGGRARGGKTRAEERGEENRSDGGGTADEMRGWVRDGVDQQTQFEERLKSEIRAVLMAPLAGIVNLVEKRAADLEERMLLQEKQAQGEMSGVSHRVDKLDLGAQQLLQRMESLSSGLDDALDKLARLKELEMAVQELKKNVSVMGGFQDDQAAGGRRAAPPKKSSSSGVDASVLDGLAKRVKQLDRLSGVYKHTMEHNRNETKREYRELSAAVRAGGEEVQQRLLRFNETLEKRFQQARDDFNDTHWARVAEVDQRFENAETSLFNMNLDINSVGRKINNKIDPNTEDLRHLEDVTDRLQRRQDEVRGKVGRLQKNQKKLIRSQNATAVEVDELRKDIRLNVDSGWVPLQFDYDSSRTGCFGDQYVRRTSYKNAGYVGVVLCSPERYKILLSTSRKAKFLNIADDNGLGEDHCEFVGAPEGSQATISPYDSRYDHVRAFVRKNWADEPELGYINMFRHTPLWYECGVSIP